MKGNIMTDIRLARKVTFYEAKRAFAAGGVLLVTERPEGEFHPVGKHSTTHSRDTTTFAELHAQVKMWRNRYPRQTFYVVENESS